MLRIPPQRASSSPSGTPPVQPAASLPELPAPTVLRLTRSLSLPRSLTLRDALTAPVLPITRSEISLPQLDAAGALAFPPTPRETTWEKGAHVISIVLGRPIALFSAIFLVVLWGVLAVPMHADNTWLMIMSVAASIEAALVVLVVQTDGNRNNAKQELRQDHIETRTVHNEHQLAALTEDMADIKTRVVNVEHQNAVLIELFSAMRQDMADIKKQLEAQVARKPSAS